MGDLRKRCCGFGDRRFWRLCVGELAIGLCTKWALNLGFKHPAIFKKIIVCLNNIVRIMRIVKNEYR